MSQLTYRTASEINTAMAGVYKHMSIAVAISMLVSYAVGSNADFMSLLFGSPVKWLVIFAPLAFAFAVPYLIKPSTSSLVARATLYAFSAVMGLSLSTVFVTYTATSIFTAFIGAAVLFATMSIYGYLTKKSLDQFGQWFFIGLIAVIVASLINLLIGSTLFQMAISAAAVLLFMGLTAYDTQRIRGELVDRESVHAEIMGALHLYLNYINLFTGLLQIFGTENE